MNRPNHLLYFGPIKNGMLCTVCYITSPYKYNTRCHKYIIIKYSINISFYNFQSP